MKIDLVENQYGLQLTMGDYQSPLPGQTIDETITTLNINFEIVRQHYTKTASGTIEIAELNEVCLKIVLYYFGLYNSWKYSNEKEKDRDLIFLSEDFKHPYTMDIIIQYFKNRYPKDYAGKCASMLDMSAADLLAYEYNRADFYNSFR